MKTRKDNEDTISSPPKAAKATITVHKEKLSCVRVSFGKVVEDTEQKNTLRNDSKKLTEIRWLGARALNDFIVCNTDFEILKKSLINIIQACFTIDTKGVDMIQKSLRGNTYFSNWYTCYPEDFSQQIWSFCKELY